MRADTDDDNGTRATVALEHALSLTGPRAGTCLPQISRRLNKYGDTPSTATGSWCSEHDNVAGHLKQVVCVFASHS